MWSLLRPLSRWFGSVSALPPAQIFHYVYAYLQLTSGCACWADASLPLPLLSFAIPTGAAGHVTAGTMAALMGLPIHRLLMATNEASHSSLMYPERPSLVAGCVRTAGGLRYGRGESLSTPPLY